MIDLLALGEQPVELDLTQHRSQRRLGELAGGVVVVLDLGDRFARAHDPEVDHRVDLDGDVVAGDDVLRRDIVHDRP